MFSRPLLHQREGSVRRLKCVIAKLGERCRHGMRRFLRWRGHQSEGAVAVGQGGGLTFVVAAVVVQVQKGLGAFEKAVDGDARDRHLGVCGKR